MKYFKGVGSLEELKISYKALCKIHHPDLGGSTEAMQEINAEYSALLRSGRFDLGKSSAEIEDAIRNVIEETTVLAGLTVELCGRWVWITGETYQWREKLKAIGCLFASKKKAWYWRPADEENKRKGKNVPLEAIRAKYGSEVFESKEPVCLA